MKKLVIMAIGLSLSLGTTIALASPQDTTDTTKKKKKKKKAAPTDTTAKFTANN